MAHPSTSNLKQLFEYQSKSEQFEMFDGQGQLVLIVARFVIKLLSEDDEILVSLRSLEESAIVRWSYSHHSQEDRKFSESFWSFVKQLEVFFQVPSITSSAKPNELVASFIDLLLEVIEEILDLQPYFIHRVQDSMKKLKMELKFLVAFLGDTPSQSMELETTTKILTTIDGVANEVGNFLYSFFFSNKRISMVEMKQKLDGLFREVEELKESIKIHCVMVAMIQPNGMTQKTAVVSLSLVDPVVAYLDDLMSHRDERIVDLMDQIEIIREYLVFLLSVLGNVDLERHPKFKELSAQVQEVAHEVEYILRSFSLVWYLTLRIPYIIEKIQLIKMMVQEMKIEKYDASQEALLLPPNFSSFEDTLVGRQDEVMEIIWLVLHGPQPLRVISICGMPGLGKTAVARNIYDHPTALSHFNILAWCSISETYQRKHVLIDILSCISQVNRETMHKMEDEDLANNVYKGLKGRRYLIIIDQIQNVNVWHDIKPFFPDDDCGSRILLTCQGRHVAWTASTQRLTHSLRFLNDDECWHLFQSKVFGRNRCPQELIDVGKEIARNCFGLPFLVVKFAAQIANMPRVKTLWMEVAQNIILKEIDDYKESLYNHLPMHLRPCLLYFGLFEKGREILVQKLFMLWDAEGFIDKKVHKNSDDIAEEYLMDLIDWRMVLVSKQRSRGGAKACIVDDVMHDICSRIAERENFIKVIKERLSIFEQHRLLSIRSNSIPSFSRPFGLNVRSLLGHLPDPSAFMFRSLTNLKILDLATTELSMYDLTGSECCDVLKFLSVSSIPSSIEMFKNLEFLFVDNKEVAEIPATLLNMAKLRHVHFSGGAQFNETWPLEAPHDERFLINNLQNLSSLLIYNENDQKILRCLPNLRTLKGRFTAFRDPSKNRYYYLALDFLVMLESLNISFLPTYTSDDIIPKSMRLPYNLKKLTLHNFNLSQNHISEIARLPKLEVLKFQDNTIEGKQWDTSEGEFTNLRHLELDSIQIERWNMCDDSFPVLQALVLVRCQILEEIPSTLGELTTLQKIEVHGCATSVEISARQIKEEQLEYGNDDLKIIISNFSL